MPWSQARVRVESGGQPPEQGDGGLGAALFDALDLIDGHVSPAGQVGDAQTQGAALIVYGLAEGQCLANGDPLRILGVFGSADPRIVHDPKSDVTHTVISNSPDGAWPITRRLDKFPAA